jgi:PucR C-terminal helix-turn-helix domain
MMPQSADPDTGTWPRISPEWLTPILPKVDRLTEEMIDAVQWGVPEYARPLNDTYRTSVRSAVTHAVQGFLQRITDPASPADQTEHLFRNIGRGEAAEGRNLEPLQAALRLGARIAWRRLGERAAQGDVDGDVLAQVGEAIFLYLDELACACSEGFAEATAQAAGEMERRRSRLLDLIVADPPASQDAIADLAQAARWALPRKVAAVALEHREPDYCGPFPALPPDALIDLTRRHPCALVPDPDGPGRAQAVECGLRGWTGAIGPVQPLAQASRSLRWARQALALAKRGIMPAPGGVIRCTEQLPTLVILADEDLTRTLVATRLAPLRQVRPEQQEPLAQTLLCWLQCGGNAREVARRLHIHPQTARYRMRQLHLLFGEDLLEADVRFGLEIALRVQRLGRPPADRDAAAALSGQPSVNGHGTSAGGSRPPVP